MGVCCELSDPKSLLDVQSRLFREVASYHDKRQDDVSNNPQSKLHTLERVLPLQHDLTAARSGAFCASASSFLCALLCSSCEKSVDTTPA